MNVYRLNNCITFFACVCAFCLCMMEYAWQHMYVIMTYNEYITTITSGFGLFKLITIDHVPARWQWTLTAEQTYIHHLSAAICLIKYLLMYHSTGKLQVMIRVKNTVVREREERRKRGERERWIIHEFYMQSPDIKTMTDPATSSPPLCLSPFVLLYLSVCLTCNAFRTSSLERFYMYCKFCNINMYTSTHLPFLSCEGDDFKALFCEETEGRGCWHMHALTHQY